MAAKYCVVLLVAALVICVDAESVLFPYGERFNTVDLDSLPTAEQELHDPVYDTGSYLYDSQATAKTLDKKLGMNIPIRQFKSPASRYFRAHPTFIKCAELVLRELLNQDFATVIIRGYITLDEFGDELDGFHQSGSALELGVSEPGTVDDIAAAVLRNCPAILERELRDLGLVLFSDKVHFRMSAADNINGPDYSLDSSYTGTITDLDTWAQERINEGLEPTAASTCENYQSLASGARHPSDRTQEEIVGMLDVRITRDMLTDFGRLKQYQGSNIVFENSESSAGWCSSDGTPCPTVCDDKIQGNSVQNRCADRVMSPRLYNVLNKVGKKIRDVYGEKLVVLEAWDEGIQGSEEGESEDDTLHYEGRAAKLHVESNDDTKLGDVAKYAACFGGDYVEHRGTYVYVSVKRAKPDGGRVTFPSITLLEVEPPEESSSLYVLPASFSESESANYPLFDGAGKEDTEIATGVTIRQFMSRNSRYFRVDTSLVACYRDVVYAEKQRRADDDPEIEMTITRSYLTNRENSKKFDVLDKRYNRHILGNAMQLSYAAGTQSEKYTPLRLLYKVIDKCAWRFHQEKKLEMGVGLYQDSVFFDSRPTFTVMPNSLVPENMTEDEFHDALEERFDLAKLKRVVDPNDYTTACLFQTAPQPQSSAFEHQDSEAVKRKRRRKRSADDESCVPRSDTEFCRITKPHREKVVNKLISTHLDRKHYSERPREQIIEALEGCFLACGTCLEGSIWDEKTKHCNNFIHWVNWTLMNDEADMSNAFVSLERHACEDGEHCVYRSPLFSLVAPTYYYIFRPDESSSVEEFLYAQTGNPSPVMSLIEDMYLIHAKGVVKFWVYDDTEMTALKRHLEVAMLYNKQATRIDVHVERYKLTKDAVTGIIEKEARTMANQGCPEVTRATLTPYKVLEVPAAKRKRAAEESSIGIDLRKEKLDLDGRWLRKNRHF